MWRYQTCEKVEINARVEQVYAIASDPKMVPVYAPEVAKIEVLNGAGQEQVLVRSYFKVAGLTFPTLYRYHYRAPRYYGGFQQGGRLLRGYFKFVFIAEGNRTVVSHTEGILSIVPGLAFIAGFIYVHLLSRHGIQQELAKLKELVENSERIPRCAT